LIKKTKKIFNLIFILEIWNFEGSKIYCQKYEIYDASVNSNSPFRLTNRGGVPLLTPIPVKVNFSAVLRSPIFIFVSASPSSSSFFWRFGPFVFSTLMSPRTLRELQMNRPAACGAPTVFSLISEIKTY
jgi:hypothetical protein